MLDPQQSEESAVADRMEELGMGLRIRSEDPDHIREALERVLAEPSYKEQTVRIARSFREAGGARRAAEYILSCRNT